MTLRLLSYNIRFGGTGRETLLAGVIQACEPDLVILQEATDPGVVDRLAELCQMRDWGAAQGHSLAYLSRVAIADHAWHPVPLGKRRYLSLTLADGPRVYGVHLSAIHSNLTEVRRSYEMRALLRDLSRQPKGFHLVTGDFNTLAPGEQLDVSRLPARLRAIVWMTGGQVRWRTIKQMLDAGYADGYRLFHPSTDAGYTFPTWDPHVRLDYLFVPTAYVSRVKRCDVVRDAPGVREASDHFPLFMEVSTA